MLPPSADSGRACRRCYSPLVEILSDEAGRLFGCRRCRGVDMHDAAPPADVIERGTRTRRERRRMARGGRRLRLGARRVARSWERTVPRPVRWVVMPLWAFPLMHAAAKDIGEGWGFGLVNLESSRPLRLHMLPAYNPAERMTPIETKTIEWQHIGGGSFGLADKRAPEALVLAAFDRFTHERTGQVIHGFLRECR